MNVAEVILKINYLEKSMENILASIRALTGPEYIICMNHICEAVEKDVSCAGEIIDFTTREYPRTKHVDAIVLLLKEYQILYIAHKQLISCQIKYWVEPIDMIKTITKSVSSKDMITRLNKLLDGISFKEGD